MKVPNYLIEALLLYEENISQTITLEGLEQKLHVSKNMISKCFKKFLYMTPPINEVAQQIGISNVSHFINTFKRNFERMTPAQYRHNHYMKI